MSNLDHWRRDHISNIRPEDETRDLVQMLTPSHSHVCGVCGWPGSFTDLCSVCTTLTQAIVIMLDRDYWRRIQAQERMEREAMR